MAQILCTRGHCQQPAENSSGHVSLLSHHDATQMPNTDHLHLTPGINLLLSPIPISHATVWKSGIPTAPGNWHPLQYSFYQNNPSFEAVITILLMASVRGRSSLALTCLIEDCSDISVSNISTDTTTYTGLCFCFQTLTKNMAQSLTRQIQPSIWLAPLSASSLSKSMYPNHTRCI